VLVNNMDEQEEYLALPPKKARAAAQKSLTTILARAKALIDECEKISEEFKIEFSFLGDRYVPSMKGYSEEDQDALGIYFSASREEHSWEGPQNGWIEWQTSRC